MIVNNSQGNKVPCPHCLGLKQVMEPKPTHGFEYKECRICQGTGEVSQQLEDDYIFAMNEDNFEEDDLV